METDNLCQTQDLLKNNEMGAYRIPNKRKTEKKISARNLEVFDWEDWKRWEQGTGQRTMWFQTAIHIIKQIIYKQI